MLVAVCPQQVPGSFQEGLDQQEAKVQVAVQLWVAVVGTPMALQVLPPLCVFVLGGGVVNPPK